MTSPLPSEQTFQRNLAALAAIAPDFHRRMATMTPPTSRIVPQPDDPGDVNLEFDGRLFYQEGGAGLAALRQVEAYLQRPERLNYTAPPRNGMDEDVTDFVRARLKTAVPQAAEVDVAAGPAPNRGGALIMLGAGLGHQLDLLFQRLEFRHLALIEPYAELLWHSLWLQDWVGWIERLAARGGSICLLVGDEAESTAEQLEIYLRTRCYGTLDASYLYRHYDSAAIEYCRKEIVHRLLSSQLDSRGFFEDQLTMLRNTTRNLVAGPVRLAVNNPLPPQPLPAIIVGAGPSLDKALPELARLRGAAVVFSAGSTLRTLLNHGLLPDFQCEIENGGENYEALAPLAAAHDLSGITLLASTTVDPRIPGLFGQRILYLRDSMVSTALYGTDRRTILGTSPNCLTLALRMAAEFGFRDIYLFGADFGSRRPDRHHAADSVWMTDPDWQARYDAIAEKMEIVVPGNFGGRVFTNHLLKGFLGATEQLLAGIGHVRVVNCSDGARVRGATARLAAQVKLPDIPDGTAGRAVAAAAAASEAHAPGALVDPSRLAALHGAFRDWAGRVLDALRASRLQGQDLVSWNDILQDSFERIGEQGAAIRFLAEGSVMTMFKYAFHRALWHRGLDDGDLQDALIAGLAEALARMDDRLGDVIGESRHG